MKKKILAILTTACLVISMFPVAAFAHDDGEGGANAGLSEYWGDNCLNYDENDDSVNGQTYHNFGIKTNQSWINDELGLYFGGESYKWHHHCTAQAKVVTSNPDKTVYFHDLDNALLYANQVDGTLYPMGNDVIDGKISVQESTTSQTTVDKSVGTVSDGWLTIEGNVVLDLSDCNKQTFSANGIVVKSDASFTVKGGKLALSNNGIEASGNVTIETGAEVYAYCDPAIQALDSADVTIKGQISALNTAVSAKDKANITLKSGSVVMSSYKEMIKIDQLVEPSEASNVFYGVELKDSATLNTEKGSTIFAKEYKNIKSIGVGIYDNAAANLAGDVRSENYIAVLQNGEKSELNITGGSYTGKTAIWTMSGKSNIDASKNSIAIEATQETCVAYTKTSDYPTTTGDAIVIENAGGEAIPSISGVSANLVVKTGSDETQSVAVYPAEKAIAGFISAGTYDKNPSATYLAEGYKTVADNDLYKVVSGATTLKYCNVVLSTYIEKFDKTNGTARPEVTVKVDGKELVADQDYELSYEDADSVGIAKVIVKGIGNYTGTVEKRYAVVGQATPENLKNTDATGGYTVKVIGNYFVYNGQEIKPLVYVKMGSLIVSSNEYDITYSNNTNAGTATVSVTSKAKTDDVSTYSGTATFEIQKRNLYIIPDSYTKKSTDKVTFSATAYGYVSGDKGIVESYIDEDLSYGLRDKDSNNILTGKISDGELDLSKLELDSGVYYIVFSQARPDNQELENYNINVSAKGKLIILNANGTMPTITVEKTGNSLIDAINQTIENAKDAIQSALKKNSDNDSQTVDQTTTGNRTIAEEIQAAVKQAHEFWAKLTHKLNVSDNGIKTV